MIRHRARRLWLRSGIFLVTLGGILGLVPPTFAQQAADTTSAAADTGLGSGDGFLLWDLIGEAGGFQYPIFGLLGIGLFLISAKLYELYSDRRAAQELEEASLEGMEMNRIAMLVANQKKSMLADLQATMLNVFQTTKDAGTLHEEIANFIQFQRERFGTFKQRIDFLADTAGAVGLLGTVWGILRVFTGGGIDDEQRVLAGMGIALVSTLLGLVVSITLNLISTEVYSFFDNRLDQIEDKADELRFRLLELGLSQNGTAASGAESSAEVPPAEARASGSQSTQSGRPDPQAQAPAAIPPEDEFASERGSGAGQPVAEHTDSPVVATEPTPKQLDVAELSEAVPVASSLTDISVKLQGGDGEPVADEVVQIEVEDGSGHLEDGRSQITRRTGNDGTLTFDWCLPEAPGPCSAVADVPSADASGTTVHLSVRAHPGAPKRYAQGGNNQGAEVGSPLPKPLSVRIFDAYNNPVPDHQVKFQVESGEGRFDTGKASVAVPTNESGEAAATFWVGEKPGLNTVSAVVGDEKVSFQAMALEQ
ncbi:MotA/TolQ/ExbB proton channel family protein [Salinibacter altiplanensis]|uniref:MotA/TolQ/ExbB proton channel family protein n=1 Tax=Salinibacter altiplanensis TaxID=1803181 RepID=UPI000C9FEC6D|nr:MotA/TolQ/ExbB proton channel family protein [Salinibacter altiplanensis]